MGNKYKICVTGSAGFVGSNLVDALIEQGHEVIGIDDLSTGKRENINPKAEFRLQDIVPELSVGDCRVDELDFTGVDYVFHCAALARMQPSIIDPFPSHKTNTEGTLRVLWEAKQAGVKRVIYSASSSAYGHGVVPFREDAPVDPQNPYALQKVVGEQYCRIFSQLYGLDTVCLRYFNVYGNRQCLEGQYAPVIGLWERQHAEGKRATIVGSGHATRDFTIVQDVVSANIKAMEHPEPLKGEIFNVGTGFSITILGLANLLGYKTEFIPPRLGEVQETRADISNIKRVLGWEPTITMYQWAQENSKKPNKE